MIAANDPERAGKQLVIASSMIVTGGSPYLNAIRDTAVGTFVNGQLLRAPMQVLSALDELSLIRETASRSVELYAKARDLELANPTDARYSMMADKAAVIMQEQLQLVVKTIEQASRVATSTSRAYSYASLCEISRIMLNAVSDVIGDDRPDLLLQINERLQRDFAEIRAMEPEQNLVLDELRTMDGSLATE